ncbi:GNAT family N-acetyltransferase [Wenzhouxiangella sp. EGI_FJ10305]|uniref:GNAT family N-acetyltransferase n=1 Tax=Wenzhouxiangella sp. EGI_FJ10305 TaxID=3243768 RepID=UPI0035DA6336
MMPQRQPSPYSQVEVITSPATFSDLRSEWNALVSRTDDQVFYRHEFIETWLHHFATGKWRILLLRDTSGRLVAALPLIHGWARLHGLPLRQLRGAANPHSGRFDLIADEPEPASAALFDYLAGQRDWDVMILTELPSQGRVSAMEQVAGDLGLPVGRWCAMQSPCLMLPATWAELEGQLSRHFRANLRRRRRALEKLGEVRAERCSDSAERVEAGIELELRGWKGRAGTAMAQDVETRGFYADLARVFGPQGRLALWALYLDERLIAFQFGLEHRNSYALLKPAYDESLARYSPGQLLMAEVLRDAIARRLTRFEFLGEDMPWKRDWHPETHAQDWLFVFRRSAGGRFLHALKFRLLPRLRRMTRSKHR